MDARPLTPSACALRDATRLQLAGAGALLLECKKNGTVIWSRVRCLDNRFINTENKKSPQSKFYTLDFVHDNIQSAALDTRDARALEFNLTLGAADTIKAIVELLDIPRNL